MGSKLLHLDRSPCNRARNATADFYLCFCRLRLQQICKMKVPLISACVAVTLAQLAFGSRPPGGRGDVTCQHPAYRVHIMSSEPLVIYIKDFLTEGERRHLLHARCVFSQYFLKTYRQC